MILKAGLETGYGSVLELVDAAVPSQLLDPIRQTIQQVEGVKGCSHLRGRRAGSSLHLDVNIEVDPFYSVSAAHEVEKNVRDEIWKSHSEVAEVFIHIEPSFSNVSFVKMDQQKNMKGADHLKSNVSSNDKHIEDIISALLAAKFAEGQTLLQVEVSMPPDILVRDAIKLAEEAEKDILVAVSDVVHVCIQLQLGGASRHEF